MPEKKARPATTGSVDAYLALLPVEARTGLQKLREAIRAAAPGAVEGLSYGLQPPRARPMRSPLHLFLVVFILVSLNGSGSKAPGDGCRSLDPGQTLTAVEFRAVLDSVAAGWNRGNAELAAGCFTETAVYLEPPDRQLYRGRPALREFFAQSILPARPDRMTWHQRAFDEEHQVGLAEYTYSGRQLYHGVAIIRLERGLIQSWREYQYAASDLEWERFIGPTGS